MDVRKKLVELMCESPLGSKTFEQQYYKSTITKIADHLIAHGVTVREWISVTEKLPENEQDVIICAQRRYYKGGTIPVISTAFHTDGKMNTEESVYNWDSDLDMQYDEENDVYIVPEGWWESVNYGEQFGGVCDFVTHWMPLPQPPKGE